MAGIDNLTPYEKGQSGNPAGKPKGIRNRSTIIREIIEHAAAEALKSKNGLDLGVQPETIFDQLVLQQVIKAATGDTQAMNFLADSAFGKLTDKVENRHTFTQMGRVVAAPVVAGSDTQKPVAGVALTFEVGTDPVETEEGAE